MACGKDRRETRRKEHIRILIGVEDLCADEERGVVGGEGEEDFVAGVVEGFVFCLVDLWGVV